MVRRLVGSVALIVSLSACSGTQGAGSPDDEPADSATESAVEPVAPELPSGVETDPPGTTLELGDAAVVAWRPTSGSTGVLRVSVTAVAEQRPRLLDRFLLDEASEDARPYFVEVILTNAGETDLGGLQVPLYLRDDLGRLNPAWTVGEGLEECASGPFPDPFAPGDAVDMCLLYLVPSPGVAEDVVFRPSDEVEPVAWSGEILTPERGRGGKGKGKRSGQR